MADTDDAKARGPFRRFFFRGLEARARRRFARGHVNMQLIRRLRKAKKDCEHAAEKPQIIKTHLRNMIIVPEMVSSVVGVYNGKSFTEVEVKPHMIGHYLGEFSITYKPVRHGRSGVGADSKFIPLK